jgi:class 3 adenylate cyclase
MDFLKTYLRVLATLLALWGSTVVVVVGSRYLALFVLDEFFAGLVAAIVGGCALTSLFIAVLWDD